MINKIFKYNYYYLFFLFVYIQVQAMNVASKLAPIFKNTAQEISQNKGKLIKAGLGWGGVSGAYYAGSKYIGDLNPEVSSDYKVPQDLLDKVGVDSFKVVYVSKSSLNTKDSPENRWLVNGKGFFGNLFSLLSPSDTYIGTDGKLRIPLEKAKELSEGKGIDQFLHKVTDQKDRYSQWFDWKTIAGCAVDTALWTPAFMLSPVVKLLKSTTGAFAYFVPAIINRGIIASREKNQISKIMY